MFDNKDYCEACYADTFLTEDEYEQWEDGDLELYTGDYEGTCCCCGKYTCMVSSVRRPDWDSDDDEDNYEEDRDDRGTELIDTFPSMGGVDFRHIEHF